MGVLDEAIKHHLELKRRHGADPSEVAELEREAFGEDLHAFEQSAFAREARDAEHQGERREKPTFDGEEPKFGALYREDDGLHQLRAEFSAAPPQALSSPLLHEETMELDIPSLFSEPVEEQGQSAAFRS